MLESNVPSVLRVAGLAVLGLGLVVGVLLLSNVFKLGNTVVDGLLQWAGLLLIAVSILAWAAARALACVAEAMDELSSIKQLLAKTRSIGGAPTGRG